MSRDFAIAFSGLLAAAELVEVKNLAYRAQGIAGYGMAEICKLVLYHPAEGDDLPSLLWFHGGSLTTGSEDESARIGANSG
jgi:hypothetical protein